MFVPPLSYAAPRSISEAVQLLRAGQGAQWALAGGTDILPALKERRAAPAGLVSLRHLKELRGIRLGPVRTLVGAATPISRLAGGITDRNPAFGDFLRQMGSPQIRNRATLGGNLCTAAACADSPAVLMVARAALHVFGPTGARTIQIEDFHTGMRKVDLHPGELIAGIEWDADLPGSAYVKIGARGAMNINVVGVAAAVSVKSGHVTDVRLAASGVGPTPLRASERLTSAALGLAPGSDLWRELASHFARSLPPYVNVRAGAEYRTHLVEVAARQALTLAFQRFHEHMNRGGRHG